MNQPTPEEVKALKAKVTKAENKQNPFTAKYGRIMIYIINNN